MSRSFTRRCALGAIVFLLSFSGARSARAHGDVWLYADTVNTKLALGLVDESGTDFTPGVRVFEAILTPDTLPFSQFDVSAEEPGFQSAAGDLPPSQPISLTVDSLAVWNGSTLVPVTDASFSFNLAGGFASSPSGGLHDHAPFGLGDLTADSLPIADGVYVAGFMASTAGLGASDVGYLVMLHDSLIADEDDAEALAALLEDYENGGPAPIFGGKDFSFLEDVHEYVEATIPEPTSASLVAAAFGLAAIRRRS
jgi:hypothetical protein